MKGVVSVESGYSNGHISNPTYREVCGGEFQHGDAVLVTMNPDGEVILEREEGVKDVAEPEEAPVV